MFATPARRGEEDDPPLTPAEAAAEAAAEAYLAQSTPRRVAAEPLAPLALSPAAQVDTTALPWTPPPAPPLVATPTSAFPLPQLPPSRRLPPPFRAPHLSPPRGAQLPPPRDSHVKAAQRRVAQRDEAAKMTALVAATAGRFNFSVSRRLPTRSQGPGAD